MKFYAGDSVTRVAGAEYSYDEFRGAGGLQDTPDIVYSGHDLASDPYIPGAYNPITEYRGNVTTVKRYANAAALSNPTIETHHYDITGNIVTANHRLLRADEFSFNTVNTQFTWPESQTSGSATAGANQNLTSATFDFNTGLVRTATDANGRGSQVTYDSNTLRPIRERIC